MRAMILRVLALAIALLCPLLPDNLGQPLFGQSRNSGPPDVEKEILRQLKEAYKAPFEVHQDVLSEIRRNYKQPSAQREMEVFRELQRLYRLSPEREQAILRQMRIAYDDQSLAQEARIFAEIAKLEKLPDGSVPARVQTEQAWKIFNRLDANEDGKLSVEEMPDPLRNSYRGWDATGDGRIDANEYWAYYQDRLRSLSDDVASGKIDLGLKRGGPAKILRIIELEDEPRPIVFRAGKLPAGLPGWFEQLDGTRDGQIALYEWRMAGKALAEFASYDRNDDGFITSEEALWYIANHPEASASEAAKKQPMEAAFKQRKGKN